MGKQTHEKSCTPIKNVKDTAQAKAHVQALLWTRPFVTVTTVSDDLKGLSSSRHFSLHDGCAPASSLSHSCPLASAHVASEEYVQLLQTGTTRAVVHELLLGKGPSNTKLGRRHPYECCTGCGRKKPAATALVFTSGNKGKTEASARGCSRSEGKPSFASCSGSSPQPVARLGMRPTAHDESGDYW